MKKSLFFNFLFVLAGVNLSSAQTNALIGTCYNGGTYGHGSIFQANLDGSNIHAVYAFQGPEGAAPYGKTAQAANGKIYGVTYLGGCSDSCCLYEYDPIAGTCADVYDFYCTPPIGEPAEAGLILASDGNLYGLQQPGIMYKFNPNTHVYTLLNQAASTSYYGGLLEASDGKLYGLGINGYGTIFSYDLSTGVYSVLHNFDNTHGGTLYYQNLIQATDGKLYGTTFGGGAHGSGVIFSYDITSATYTVVYDFTFTCEMYGGLIQASNGKLYGMTYYGGTSNYGVIFSYDIAGGQYNVVHNFSGTDGANPYRSLMRGSNGKLFGVTYKGGTLNMGVAFSFDLATNTYTKLINFTSSVGNYPQSDIMEAVIPSETGITSTQSLQASVYLDEASHQLIVQNNGVVKNAMLTMIDAPGRIVLQTEIRDARSQFNLSSYPEGIYFVQLSNNRQTVTKKVILSR